MLLQVVYVLGSFADNTRNVLALTRLTALFLKLAPVPLAATPACRVTAAALFYLAFLFRGPPLFGRGCRAIQEGADLHLLASGVAGAGAGRRDGFQGWCTQNIELEVVRGHDLFMLCVSELVQFFQCVEGLEVFVKANDHGMLLDEGLLRNNAELVKYAPQHAGREYLGFDVQLIAE